MSIEPSIQNFEDWEAKLKLQAWSRKKQDVIKLGHAFERLAQEAGFKTYAAFRVYAREHFEKEMNK